MSDFYIIIPAVDTPETGNAFPAAESFDDYDFDGPLSVHKLTYGQMPDFEPDIRFRLAKGAKLTDILSQAAISAHGLLVNQRAREVFEKLRLPPHKFFSATVTDRNGDTHQYFWMHISYTERYKTIQWLDSDFFVRRISKNVGSISVSSYSDYLNKNEGLRPLKFIDFNKLFIDQVQVDIFPLIKSELYCYDHATIHLKPLSGLTIASTAKVAAYNPS